MNNLASGIGMWMAFGACVGKNAVCSDLGLDEGER